MSYLTRLSAHTLKIDQSLVRGVEPRDRSAGAWSRTSCRWAATSATASSPRASRPRPSATLLAAWGCDYGQGWHFGRPMPAGAFADWLSSIPRLDGKAGN